VAALCNRLRMALTPRGLKAENIKPFLTDRRKKISRSPMKKARLIKRIKISDA
jgi:hypothetical protein